MLPALWGGTAPRPPHAISGMNASEICFSRITGRGTFSGNIGGHKGQFLLQKQLRTAGAIGCNGLGSLRAALCLPIAWDALFAIRMGRILVPSPHSDWRPADRPVAERSQRETP